MSSNRPTGISSAGTPLPSSFDGDSDFYEENRLEKLSRRLKEEPLIPLGCLLTCIALVGASRSIRAGDHNRTQRMFRARIAAQGFTLVAMVAGSMYWQTDRQKRKEFDAVVAERKAKEKNEAWIRELEARDEEEKEIRAMRAAQRKGISYVREEKPKVEQKVGEVKKEVEKMVRDVKEKAGPAKKEVEKVAEEEVKKAKSVMDSVKELFGGGKS